MCRWCGLPILKADGTINNRSTWHPKCIDEYKLIHWPAVTRKAVYKRDKGICASCGHKCAKRHDDVWHMDHIKPLIESNGDLEYWKLPNLQTLCQKHHLEKTSLENSERARLKREARLQDTRSLEDDQK